MSEQEPAADDFSGLTSFFFYTFIIHPCTAWILRPGRFERKKSIMYAIAFLAALAAIKTGEFILFFFQNAWQKSTEKHTMASAANLTTSTFHVDDVIASL